MLASEILNCPELQYGSYKVGGHGVVTVDRKHGKAFIGNIRREQKFYSLLGDKNRFDVSSKGPSSGIIGNKLSHMRKPSAYKGKSMVSVLSSEYG